MNRIIVIIHLLLFILIPIIGYSPIQKGSGQTPIEIIRVIIITLIIINSIQLNRYFLKRSLKIKNWVWPFLGTSLSYSTSIAISFFIIDSMSNIFDIDFLIWTLDYEKGFLIRFIYWGVYVVVNYLIFLKITKFILNRKLVKSN